MIKYIIFDAYGTLLSTGNGSVDAASKILEHKNINISPEAFYGEWKKLHRRHMENLTEFLNEESIFESDLKELYKIYGIEGDYKTDVFFMLNTLGRRKVFDEVNSVLKALSRSFVLCIGSVTDDEPLFKDLKNNDIPIKNVFTSESLKIYKPKKEFYERILDALNADADEVLFVGDSLTDDVFGPQQMGIQACWVNRKNADLPDTITPDYTIHNLSELLSVPVISDALRR